MTCKFNQSCLKKGIILYCDMYVKVEFKLYEKLKLCTTLSRRVKSNNDSIVQRKGSNASLQSNITH